jgi:hypothetical protein
LRLVAVVAVPVKLPTKLEVAVIIPALTFPVISILPVPLIFLEFKSKSPPNCGVVSLTTS